MQFNFSGLLATSDATVFAVHGRQDPGAICFDDFAVTSAEAANVPEPASLALLPGGLGLLGVASRRKVSRSH